MKKHLLKLIVAGLIAFSADLHGFTAVTSGLWSDSNTWGGIGPGSTVTNQDIIIPSGITVDFDMDVTFNGPLNSFWVTGTLNGSITNQLTIQAGTLTGSGTIFIRKLTLAGVPAIYSFTGPLNVSVFENDGAVVNLASTVVIYDTLQLDQGIVSIGAGSDLQLMLNSNVVVTSGSLVNNGGIFTTGMLYDVWYYGGTKTSGEELNSGFVRDIHLVLSNNTMQVNCNTNVSVMGILYMISGQLDLNGKRLTIYGDIAANPGSIFESSGSSDLVITGWGGTLSSGLMFTPGSSLDELIIDRNYIIDLESSIMISGILNLSKGHLVVGTSATLTMGTGSVIKRIQGHMMVDGMFDGTQQYSVQYVGDSCTTDVELSGSGLHSVLIQLWQSYRVVRLTQDLIVPGDIILMNGEFDLNDNDLTLTGTFHQENTALIWGSLLSTINMSMSSSVDDTLYLRQAFYPVNQLIIDIPASSTVTLGANLFTGQLTFISGKIDAGNFILKVGTATPTITGASNTSYVVTSGWGWLEINVVANDPYVEFPIGTVASYSPIWIRQNGTTQSTGYFQARVLEGVWTNGSNGTDVSLTDNVVNKTWYVYEDSGIVVNMDIKCFWEPSSEMNSFDRQNCFIKNYTTMWDSYTPSAASSGNFGTYSSERLGLQNTGFFVVVDNTSPLNVEEPATTETILYPNPADDMLNVQVNNPDNSTFVYELFDAAGRKVMSAQSNNAKNAFDLSEYESGSYILRITNTATNEVTSRKVIKS